MIIQEGTDWLEVVVTDMTPDHLPTPWDVRLAVAVAVGGFSGRGSAWVDADRLARFVAELRVLETNRRGKASVESMSPGEFQLCVAATDRSGHMEIRGQVAAGGQTLAFRFAFCPSLLPGVVEGFASLTEKWQAE
jgi:hypothetical protein